MPERNLLNAVSIIEGLEDSSIDEQLNAWQILVNSGVIHQLQGWYGRTAEQLINQGLIEPCQSLKH